MRLDFAGERVLAVVAHPDDAELLCAGTLARARTDGAAVGVCVLCRGDKGQPAKPVADLAALWWMDTFGMHGFEPGFYVNVTDHFDLKQQMLRCHATQIERGRDRDFAPLQEMMLRQSQVRGAQAGVAAAEAFCIHRAFKRSRAW